MGVPTAATYGIDEAKTRLKRASVFDPVKQYIVFIFSHFHTLTMKEEDFNELALHLSWLHQLVENMEHIVFPLYETCNIGYRVCLNGDVSEYRCNAVRAAYCDIQGDRCRMACTQPGCKRDCTSSQSKCLLFCSPNRAEELASIKRKTSTACLNDCGEGFDGCVGKCGGNKTCLRSCQSVEFVCSEMCRVERNSEDSLTNCTSKCHSDLIACLSFSSTSKSPSECHTQYNTCTSECKRAHPDSVSFNPSSPTTPLFLTTRIPTKSTLSSASSHPMEKSECVGVCRDEQETCEMKCKGDRMCLLSCFQKKRPCIHSCIQGAHELSSSRKSSPSISSSPCDGICHTQYRLCSNQCDQKPDAQKKAEDDPKTENEPEMEQTKTEKEKDEERDICDAQCFDEKMECVLRCPFLSNENITQCELLCQTNFEHGLHQIQPDDLRSLQTLIDTRRSCFSLCKPSFFASSPSTLDPPSLAPCVTAFDSCLSVCDENGTDCMTDCLQRGESCIARSILSSLSFCQQNCRSSLLNCVELCSSQQTPLPNSPNTRPSFSMHNTERCVDQCYQKSEGCVLDCGKSDLTECERTCITKLTQCTAGESGEDNEKSGEKKEEKRGDGMSIMFSQFKIGHEAKATKGCVLAAEECFVECAMESEKHDEDDDASNNDTIPANQTQTPPNTNSSSSSPSPTPSTSPPNTNDTTAVSTPTPDELASLPCKDRCERLFEIQVAECGEDRECQKRHRKRRFDCVNECSLDTPTPSQADTEPSRNSTDPLSRCLYECSSSQRACVADLTDEQAEKGGIDACREQHKQCETRCHTPLTAEQQCQETCHTTFLQCTSVCGTDKNDKTGAGEKACLMQCRADRSDCRSMCSNSEKEEENGLCGECEASCETDHEICVENCKKNENCIEMCRTQRKDCKEDCHSPNSDYAERKKAEELAKEEERLIGHLGIHSKCEEECDGAFLACEDKCENFQPCEFGCRRSRRDCMDRCQKNGESLQQLKAAALLEERTKEEERKRREAQEAAETKRKEDEMNRGANENRAQTERKEERPMPRPEPSLPSQSQGADPKKEEQRSRYETKGEKRENERKDTPKGTSSQTAGTGTPSSATQSPSWSSDAAEQKQGCLSFCDVTKRGCQSQCRYAGFPDCDDECVVFDKKCRSECEKGRDAPEMDDSGRWDKCSAHANSELDNCVGLCERSKQSDANCEDKCYTTHRQQTSMCDRIHKNSKPSTTRGGNPDPSLSTPLSTPTNDMSLPRSALSRMCHSSCSTQFSECTSKCGGTNTNCEEGCAATLRKCQQSCSEEYEEDRSAEGTDKADEKKGEECSAICSRQFSSCLSLCDGNSGCESFCFDAKRECEHGCSNPASSSSSSSSKPDYCAEECAKEKKSCSSRCGGKMSCEKECKRKEIECHPNCVQVNAKQGCLSSCRDRQLQCEEKCLRKGGERCSEECKKEMKDCQNECVREGMEERKHQQEQPPPAPQPDEPHTPLDSSTSPPSQPSQPDTPSSPSSLPSNISLSHVASPADCKKWADGPFIDTAMEKCSAFKDSACFDGIWTKHGRLTKACQAQNEQMLIPLVCGFYCDDEASKCAKSCKKGDSSCLAMCQARLAACERGCH
ncbi:hypothetical protein BLNAU_9575 [Blattamonas nauphoetae]|uniref:Uncharacterized protein n=1 Tax=Blattamonas nauphoetae TaxID=2049346 RepID=A0ABQ9XVM7_9EUKA|nr:hypothetical protein BLNAU_9575 [Blattamonas nauphoetae]